MKMVPDLGGHAGIQMTVPSSYRLGGTHMTRNVINLLLAWASTGAMIAGAAPIQRPADEAGTIFLGPISGQDWGRPIATGDLDDDGYDETIVAASESWGGSISRVYIVRGSAGGHGLGMVDLSSNGVDQVILGAAVDDNLGSSMATGDVNGDDVDDLLICASNADFSGVDARGIAYLIFGGAEFFSSATRDLSTDANWDLRILGPVAFGDMGGANLFGGLDAHGAAVGRLNDDIYGDMVLGVHLATGSASASGRVYVIFGGPIPSGFTLNLASSASYDVRINGRANSDELGTSVLTGDLTGDGIDELILPNEYYSQGLFTSEGAVHIFRGRATWPSTFNLSTTPADITLLGGREDDNLGHLAVAADFDGDLIVDLASAAPGADFGAWNDQRGDGLVYGLLGSTSWQTGTHTIDYASATPDFLLVGEFEENLGAELACGDFNGDGLADLAASERFAGPATNGAVEVLFGRPFVGQPTFTANVDTDIHILGAPSDRIGFSLSAADVNNDGRDEVLFGTPFNNSNFGTVYIFTQVSGDFDHDGDRDLFDFAGFQGCFTGQNPPPGGLPVDCTAFDYDLDLDVDLADHAELSANLNGPS
ncbi:MAG: VCBS repeat-containing protein [bacterium]|nr:VCBS repeat-containing protein [bacterium]